MELTDALDPTRPNDTIQRNTADSTLAVPPNRDLGHDERRAEN